MSTSKIEKDGITCLRNFLSESEIIESEVSENDRSPSWDGNLLVFKIPNHKGSKSLLLGRVPVQIKASKRSANRKETFDAEISDLRNYLNEGGALFIYVIFRTTIDYGVYVKLLLPLDIEKLLRKVGRTTGTISVDVTHVSLVETFEAKCKHFLENRSIQFGGKVVYLDDLPHGPNKLVAVALRGLNWVDTLLSGDTYFYYETPEGTRLPIIDDAFSVGMRTTAPIEVNGTVFFNEFVMRKQANGEHRIEPNDCFMISFIKRKVQIRFTEVEAASLSANCSALRCLTAAATGGSMGIGPARIPLNATRIPGKFRDKLRFYEDLLSLLGIFNIDPNTLTLREINTDFQHVRALLFLFVKKGELNMTTEDEQFFRLFKIGQRRLCILFRRTEGRKYRGFNLFERDASIIDFTGVQISTSDPKVLVPGSRYLALNLPKAVVAIEGNFEHVTQDLLSTFQHSLTVPYEGFMLNCIAAFDETKNAAFLGLAEKLIGLLESTSSDPQITCLINRKQIIRRRRPFSDDEKEELINLKLENPHYLDLVLCCNILLGYEDEFNAQFRTLEEEKQKLFRSWPIYNLLKERNREKT